MVKDTESEILQQFEKACTDPNMQGNPVAELVSELVEYPSVTLESGVSVSSHSVVDQPSIGEHEQSSICRWTLLMTVHQLGLSIESQMILMKLQPQSY